MFSTVASAAAASPGSGGKALIERYLRDHIARPTVLRPVRFMSNYVGRSPPGIAGGVHRHIFPPHEPMQVIALEDIAEFAALAFADPARFTGRTLELAGHEPTPVEAAAAITKATGLPVRYQQLTDAEAAAISPQVAEGMKSRPVTAGTPTSKHCASSIPGRAPLADWLADSGAAAIRTRLTAP